MTVIATHDGSFHADEVFAVACLRLALGEVEVIRTRDPERLAAADLRVDVGGRHDPSNGDFDHHQPGGAGARPNGIPYAAFGLVWRRWGCEVAGKAVAAKLDARLVQIVDAHDNGQTVFTSSLGVTAPTVDQIISSFNPTFEDDATCELTDRRFCEAVEFAEGILRRELAHLQAAEHAAGRVRELLARSPDPRLLVLDANLPWREVVVEEAPSVLLCVYPRSDGSWGVQAAPKALVGFENRLDLPAEWAGLRGDKLARISGVEDAIFCHNNRFVVVARSREGALALAERALGASRSY